MPTVRVFGHCFYVVRPKKSATFGVGDIVCFGQVGVVMFVYGGDHKQVYVDSIST